MASKEHQELANVIKQLHVKLRIKTKQNGPDVAWDEHVQQLDELQNYASAMQKLATEHWDKNNMNDSTLSRIQWVVEKCRDYFKNGGIQAAIEKENKLLKKYFSRELSSSELNSDGYFQKDGDHLLLLDVGSCYNPFKKFNDFYTVPIDLVPATDDVIKCDFLNVEVLKNKTIADIENPCQFLPEDSFHVVVFSLLLEYLPSSKQRWVCCNKAYSVLKSNGLLIILTPDSKHATANSKLIKNWRYALASIGFILVFYEKLKHLHCLMYRKCIYSDVPKHWFSLQNLSGEDLSDPVEMISIPQDFHDYEKESNNFDFKESRADFSEEFIADTFTELPDFDNDLFV